MNLYLTIREDDPSGASRIVLATQDRQIIDAVRRAITQRLNTKRNSKSFHGEPGKSISLGEPRP